MFENLLGNPPKITHESITRIISKQLDIKLGPFTQEELDIYIHTHTHTHIYSSYTSSNPRLDRLHFT